MEINEQPKWYVVHTYSGYENSVETDLRNMIENNSLQDYIFDIKIPVEDDVVERNGKKKLVQRKKFPSYVFIKMIYTNHIWFMVTRARVLRVSSEQPVVPFRSRRKRSEESVLKPSASKTSTSKKATT